MDFEYQDFNGADAYFARAGAAEWQDIEASVAGMPLFMQASDQSGKVGVPIFDPKATNAYLTVDAATRGFHKIPVPAGLTEFGVDWDAGKNATLAEWQFSNYPFLWNNVIRSEGVFRSRVCLQNMQPVEALIVVTKSGLFPASNSTLYYEQGAAQLHAATAFGAFDIPIRLVGLTLPPGTAATNAVWTVYPNRYGRVGTQTQETMDVTWRRPGKYGAPRAAFALRQP